MLTLFLRFVHVCGKEVHVPLMNYHELQMKRQLLLMTTTSSTVFWCVQRDVCDVAWISADICVDRRGGYGGHPEQVD